MPGLIISADPVSDGENGTISRGSREKATAALVLRLMAEATTERSFEMFTINNAINKVFGVGSGIERAGGFGTGEIPVFFFSPRITDLS